MLKQIVTRHRPWLLAVILMAFALRLHNLTYHSLWFDEAVSVYWARQSIPRILEVGFTLVEDRLPPLYYLTLKGWTNLAGFSEMAVRLPSVFYGTLLVAVMAGIGAKLFNQRVGLLAAALVAANPFLIWYAQEARMYAPAVFFSALAIWAWLQICKTPFRHSSLVTRHSSLTHYSLFITHYSLFLLSAIAALYSHLYAGFLLPALGLWLVVSYPRRWRLWALFAAGGLIITLAYAPILQAIWRFSGESTPGDPLAGLPERAWWLLHSFTIWKAPLSPAWRTIIPLGVLLFVLIAYLPNYQLWRFQLSQGRKKLRRSYPPSPPACGVFRQFPFPRLLVTLLLVMPFAVATVLLLRNHLAFFGERYFIVMTPWLLLLAATGAERIGQWAQGRRRAREHRRKSDSQSAIRNPQSAVHNSPFTIHYAPFLLLFTLTLLPLPGQWSVPATKEAWRQSVAYLAEHAAPNHAILIHPDWVRHPFQYYFQGPGQTYAAFSTVTDQTPLDGPLAGVVGNHPVLWLIQSHIEAPDPERRVEQWLAARYPLVTELYPPGISLKAFAPGYQSQLLPNQATPVDIQFENGMRVVGYQAEDVSSATDALFHPPSGWLHVILYWQATRPITTEHVPFVHLVGPEGVWGANLERSSDALKLFTPSRWPTDGTIIRHDLDINLNPVTPPGSYQLVVGLHGAQTQQPLTEVEIR